MNNKRKKVYSVFHVYLISFYVICIMFVPILSTIAYLFDAHLNTTTNMIILINTILLLIFFVVGLIYLLVRRDYYERRLKPSYQREFTIVMTVWAIGMLGLGVLFIFFGGSDFYVPHFVTPIAIFTFVIMYNIGDIYFNIRLLDR